MISNVGKVLLKSVSTRTILFNNVLSVVFISSSHLFMVAYSLWLSSNSVFYALF